jgi:hypothetical protein
MALVLIEANGMVGAVARVMVHTAIESIQFSPLWVDGSVEREPLSFMAMGCGTKRGTKGGGMYLDRTSIARLISGNT